MSEVKLFKARPSKLSVIMGAAKGAESLSVGCKTYLEEWYKEQLYGRKKDIYSKEMEKGNKSEDLSIATAAIALGWGNVKKNTERVSNAYMEGECDVNMPDRIGEIKSSWDCFTFPLFEVECKSKANIMQTQGYMILYDKPLAELAYVLSDAPERLIDQAAKYKQFEYEMDDMESDLYDEVKASMCYSDIEDLKLRVKSYLIERDDTLPAKIEAKVLDCRKYIESLKYRI